MAKFLWVGKNDDNVKGASSKAYCLRRHGKTVTIKYGPVEVKGGGGGKIYWLEKTPRVVKKRFPSTKAARIFISRKKETQKDKGYDRLPGRVRIKRSRR